MQLHPLRATSVVAVILCALSFSPISVSKAQAQANSDANSGKVPVNIDNFVRAATDIEFTKYVSSAGGVNQFFHFREPTPIDKQLTIRMNRDTLYSAAVVDISQGAKVSLPNAGERYMTAMVINQDHYINRVFSGGGTYTLDMDTFHTPYVVVWIRTLVDAGDPDDIAAVNVLQDEMAIDAVSSIPFSPPNYDQDIFKSMVSAAIAFAPFVPNSFRMFGTKDEVDPIRHFIGTAGGWGGLPESEAYYLGVEPGLPVGEYKIEVPSEVPVDAFWSVSLYNADGFFEPNERNAYNINSVTGIRNNDGSMTIHLGGCADDRVNCLPIMEGWNYTVRLYQPGPEILNRSWTFPEAQPVN
jgi:hypothetical protein